MSSLGIRSMLSSLHLTSRYSEVWFSTKPGLSNPLVHTSPRFQGLLRGSSDGDVAI